jgi:hypothetical protein
MLLPNCDEEVPSMLLYRPDDCPAVAAVQPELQDAAFLNVWLLRSDAELARLTCEPYKVAPDTWLSISNLDR